MGVTPKGRFFGWELKRSIWTVRYKNKEGIKQGGRTSLQYYNILKIREAKGLADFIYPENFEEKTQELLRS